MPDRSAPIVVTPRACPFVALDGDRDRRLDMPDPLHRCFAEQVPRARSITHQAEYCLSPGFATCPIFQDWATRAAAEPLAPAVPTVASLPVVAQGAAVVTPSDASLEATRLRTDALAATGPYVPQPDEELTSSRPVPAYRATSQAAWGSPGPAGAAQTGSSVAPAAPDATTPTPTDRSVATTGSPSSSDAGAADDVPVIRSIPTPKVRPSVAPDDEDWMAPPPWLRQPTGPVWVAEAVPPPDALADVGTQGLRRPRPDAALPTVLAEAVIPGGAESGIGSPGPFGDETTGAPGGFGTGAVPAASGNGASGSGASGALSASALVAERVVGATGADAQADAGTSAELAASRYRSDIIAGFGVDDDGAVGIDDLDERPPSQQRRVPIDVHASSAVGPQARPSSRSTGSREWEGPRRFEAYAATQGRRLPMGVLVGGGAAVLAVLLLGVFLLPGMLMGSGPAATTTPAPTTETAVVAATQVPTDPTTAPERTGQPEKTPKPKTYTVKSGDTLIKIAKRHKTTVAKIQCLNHIKNANNVAVGRTLTIPPKGFRCSDL
jgi:hypothetical protein